jgi:hypothetical protein
MVVVICSIAILYMVAEQRINDLPAAAERANFQAVLEQVKTGVTLGMISRMARGGTGSVREFAGANPMQFMLDGPSNYLGEMETVTDTVRRRNAWYFESGTGELVYVVGGNSINEVWVTIAGVPVNYGQIRFRIDSVYDDGAGGIVHGNDLVTPPESERWEGVQLVPVHDYLWERRTELALND